MMLTVGNMLQGRNSHIVQKISNGGNNNGSLEFHMLGEFYNELSVG